MTTFKYPYLGISFLRSLGDTKVTWIKPKDPRPCLVRQFFEANPEARTVMIACSCPSCTPHC